MLGPGGGPGRKEEKEEEVTLLCLCWLQAKFRNTQSLILTSLSSHPLSLRFPLFGILIGPVALTSRHMATGSSSHCQCLSVLSALGSAAWGLEN